MPSGSKSNLKKIWWKSKVVWSVMAQLLYVWSFYFFGEMSIKFCIGNTLISTSTIVFRALTTKAITLRNGG